MEWPGLQVTMRMPVLSVVREAGSSIISNAVNMSTVKLSLRVGARCE